MIRQPMCYYIQWINIQLQAQFLPLESIEQNKDGWTVSQNLREEGKKTTKTPNLSYRREKKKHIAYTNIFLRQINSEMLLLRVLFIVVVFVLIAWLVNGIDFNLIPILMPRNAITIFQCFGNVTKVMCY